MRMVSPTIIYNGRTETYTHSDGITQNKGSCIIRVDCQSEFGAKTAEFKAFCKRAAMLCYGANSEIYADVIVDFPELEQARKDLEEVLGEKITIKRIVIVTLMKDVWTKDPDLSKFIKIAPMARMKMPLFEISKDPVMPLETSQVTEPAALAEIEEKRFDPIVKNGQCESCGPNVVCNSSIPDTCSMCPVDELVCGGGRGYPRCLDALKNYQKNMPL